MKRERILIVGGGASGVILAAHLLRDANPRLDVTIVERRPAIGAGVAYGTDEPDHLLNTRAASMSAFPDDPDHFFRWLGTSRHAESLDCADPFCFVPRRVYRDYLNAVAAPFAGPEGDGRLHVVAGECVALREHPGGIAVELGDGRTEIAGTVVLATGHTVPSFRAGTHRSGPWCSPAELGIGPAESVVIVGTGLSMIDNVVQLRRAGHRGTITAVSRRGLLPHVHAPSTPLRLDPADIPFGTGVSFLLRWLRETARWAEGRGGDWRDLVDALRPHAQTLWQSMAPDARRRFLRHARTFWEVHRHRMAPEAEKAVREAIADGQLRILAGRVLDIGEADGHGVVRLRRRDGEKQELVADHVIDCTGILRDPASGDTPLVGRLLQQGSARLDPLGLGLDVDRDCAVIHADGTPSRRLFALGPVTRAQFWEITAIPDIRVQSAGLARRLAERATA
ncbi:FAD/NAD(P)-binding protein [Aureimonas psammosilenae]|uniref:FAD/NAD(P)-binding protein n=1 Tax=Aureimonas psammosilenae TaxID=2495496 RepID=UPI001260FC93|nr:FAD/NAD(P)-binding protein [Aureimonas psammosilenae]